MNKLLLLLFLTINVMVQAQVTLDECQELARANHPLIQQYQLIDLTTEYTLSNAGKAWLPQASINVIGGYIIQGLPAISMPGQTPSDPDRTQLIGMAQLNQVLYDGGAVKARKEITKAAAGVEKASNDVTLYLIRERVNQVYFGILLIDEQMKQLAIMEDNLSRNLKNISLIQQNGLAYQPDIDEVKSELLVLEQRKIEFTHTRKGYLNMLSLLTGRSFDENTLLSQPVTGLPGATPEIRRPELGLYANQLKLTEAESAMSQVSLMPKVGLMGTGILIEPGIGLAGSKINSLAIAGLSLSWNIDGLYKHRNNQELTKVKTNRILNQQNAFLFTHKIQLTQALSDIEKQQAIIAKDEEIVRLKSAIARSYQLKYDNGMCTMNDLLLSLNRESEARAGQALHKVQLLMSLYNYKTISGN